MNTPLYSEVSLMSLGGFSIKCWHIIAFFTEWVGSFTFFAKIFIEVSKTGFLQIDTPMVKYITNKAAIAV